MKLVGYYDYTVIATYAGLASSVFGMTQAMDGHFRTAIMCLALSGFCDMLDGRIARRKKERTEEQKLFGMQIDSLSDVICFGIYPTMICYLLGVKGIFGAAAIVFYCCCSVIRLGYFNVLETRRQLSEDGCNVYYHGLPITSIAVILPLTFLLEFAMSERTFSFVLAGMLVVAGALFIIDFKFKKPTGRQLIALVLIVALAVAAILLFSNYKIRLGKPLDGPLIERISD